MSYLEFGAGDISPLTLPLGGLFIASLSLLFLDLRGWQCGYGLSPTRHAKACFHDTEGWCKIWKKTNLWFGKWHEEYGKFPSEQFKVSKLGWWDPLIQSRKSMSLKSTEELCVMTMKNDAKFEEELTFSKLTWGIWLILTRALESLK